MSVSPTTKTVILVVLLALLVIAPIPAGAQTKQDVDRAEAAKEQAYQDLLEANQAVGSAISELEGIEAELNELTYTITRLDRKIQEFDSQVEELRANAQEVVVEAYTNSGAGLVTAAFTAGSIQDLLTSQTLIGQATDRDLASLDLLTAVNRENDRLKVEIAEKQTEVEVLEQQQVAVVERLSVARQKADEVFEYAKDKYQDVYADYQAELKRQAEAEAKRREAEAAAARAANNSSGAARSSAAAGLPAATTQGVACPVAGNTWFIDTWGAARPGGRTHKGVDMSGAQGTPLVAMNSGKVRLNWHSDGGRQVYVYGDDGNFYYYAHLSGYAAGLSNGDRVGKGELVGYMGATGNASVSHLHLGMGRTGGAYVNPYPTVRAAC